MNFFYCIQLMKMIISLSWRNVCSYHTRILICVGTFRFSRHLSSLHYIWFHSWIRFLAYPFNKQCQSSLWWYWFYYHWHSLLIRFTSGIFSVLSKLVLYFWYKNLCFRYKPSGRLLFYIFYATRVSISLNYQEEYVTR